MLAYWDSVNCFPSTQHFLVVMGDNVQNNNTESFCLKEYEKYGAQTI